MEFNLDSRKKKILIALLVVIGIIAVFLLQQTITYNMAKKDGNQFLQKQEYEKAYQNFKQAEKKVILGSKKKIYYAEGECLMLLERYGEAQKTYAKVTSHKKEAEAYALEGLAYQQDHKDKKAKEAYEKAIQTETKNGIGYYYLYAYYVKNKQYEEALHVLELAEEKQVVQMKQELAFAKIVIYEKKLEYKKAYEEAQNYVKAYPEDQAGKREKEFLETR